MRNSVCQSCGMPLKSVEMLGTDINGYRIEDYCRYCFIDGQFTSNVTMDEMIKLCAKFVQNENRESVIKNMRIQFPTLKRWARKEDTQNEYHKSINKVLDYINDHLNEKPDLDTLSQIANVSPFHFHRIFKAIIGENLGGYVQRLRLEFVARQLRTTDDSLDKLSEKVGYNSQQALSKAFKKHFGIPPSVYKITKGEWNKYRVLDLSPRICKINSKHVIYIRVMDEYGSTESYSEAWKKLYTYAVLSGLFSKDSESLGVSFDDPSITEAEKCRFYACISIDQHVKPKGIFGYKELDGGLYAIFTLKGHYRELHNLYKLIIFIWLPESKYKLRKGVFYEKYLNNPHLVAEEEILTEVYIPIKE
ncbi:helix-turn-helix domain-containing protein [Dysgonomonas sp. 216]|uniref:GyrI-like domain-containing protein n=1 Tax=Dysgonomonas sp. 216 TaxID=2302934 RepID=UPI0013D3643C|nr:GyrI-like domain-containing protein [Dysgonomonas sp. 216]NDW17892.1 helix-turn-helix domain-containing protein [Dysgonomonas sp. 216]